jgi:hypothetical protein
MNWETSFWLSHMRLNMKILNQKREMQIQEMRKVVKRNSLMRCMMKYQDKLISASLLKSQYPAESIFELKFCAIYS